jgi:hypothetical protein
MKSCLLSSHPKFRKDQSSYSDCRIQPRVMQFKFGRSLGRSIMITVIVMVLVLVVMATRMILCQLSYRRKPQTSNHCGSNTLLGSRTTTMHHNKQLRQQRDRC